MKLSYIFLYLFAMIGMFVSLMLVIGLVKTAWTSEPIPDKVEEALEEVTRKRGKLIKVSKYPTRYKCPNCKKPVKNDDIYCHRCGQKLMFPHISFTDYVPGEKQETIVRWDDE